MAGFKQRYLYHNVFTPSVAQKTRYINYSKHEPNCSGKSVNIGFNCQPNSFIIARSIILQQKLSPPRALKPYVLIPHKWTYLRRNCIEDRAIALGHERMLCSLDHLKYRGCLVDRGPRLQSRQDFQLAATQNCLQRPHQLPRSTRHCQGRKGLQLFVDHSALYW